MASNVLILYDAVLCKIDENAIIQSSQELSQLLNHTCPTFKASPQFSLEFPWTIILGDENQNLTVLRQLDCVDTVWII